MGRFGSSHSGKLWLSLNLFENKKTIKCLILSKVCNANTDVKKDITRAIASICSLKKYCHIELCVDI